MAVILALIVVLPVAVLILMLLGLIGQGLLIAFFTIYGAIGEKSLALANCFAVALVAGIILFFAFGPISLQDAVLGIVDFCVETLSSIMHFLLYM